MVHVSKSGKRKFGRLFISFAVLLVFYFLFEGQKIIYECKILIYYQGDWLKTAAYIFNYFLVILIGLFFLTYDNKLIKVISIFWILFSFIINQFYKELNNSGFEYEDLLLFKQNLFFDYDDSIISTFGSSLIGPTLLTLLLLIILSFIAYAQERSVSRKYLLLVTLCSLGLSYFILHYSNAEKSTFPSYSKLALIAAYDFFNPIYTGHRKQPFIQKEENGAYDHIIWIVDESIRGDHLSITNRKLRTTPFLESIMDNHISNFGVSCSAAVCSDYSHALLMTGVRFNQLPDKDNRIRSYPTIFQYAELAGYTPALIYSPGYEDTPKSYLTVNDFEIIKTRYQTKFLNPELSYEQWDFKSLDYLGDIINTNAKSFTYFLKYGAHFHYDDAYPGSERHFEPIVGFRNFKNTDSLRLTNSYHNAVRWTVDRFFEKLMKIIVDKNVLIIYTSDHGQNLTEYPELKLTHCVRENAPQVMANVPLFILTSSLNKKQKIDSLRTKSNGTYGHVNIFPTTLEFMGYQKKDINRFYESSLFETQDSIYYTSGDIFGRSKMSRYLFEK